MKEELQDKIRNFLLGNWNQSMDSVEGALQEIIEDYTKGGLLEEIQLINSFLVSDETNDWKTDFVIKNTEIYWPNMKESPINWLSRVKSTLEDALREK